jgi:hypothetical protein
MRYVGFMIRSFSFSILAVLSGCNSSENSAPSLSSALTGLDKLPSVTKIVGTNSSSAVFNSRALRGNALFEVSGTAPLFSTLKDNADTVFWNGMMSTINTRGSATNDEKAQFWGGQDGQVGGMAACQLSRTVGEAIGHLSQAATSGCYMKGITSVASGVTVSGNISQADLFKKDPSADKTIQVNVTNMRQMHAESESMTVFLKVPSASSGYAVTLWFCSGSTLTGVEKMSADLSTGLFTQESYNSDQEGKGSSAVSAYLTVDANGAIVFDLGQPRTASGA